MPTARAAKKTRKSLPAKSRPPTTRGGLVVGGRDVTLPPIWQDILTSENLEKIRQMFSDGMDSTAVAGSLGIPAHLFETWIKLGRVYEFTYSVHTSWQAGDLTTDAAQRQLRDKKIPSSWLKNPPPRCGRYALALAAGMGAADLSQKLNKKIISEGSPSDLIKFSSLINR